MGQKNVLVVLLVTIAMLAAAGCEEAGVAPPPIASFEECAAAGHPVLESYPRKCAVPGGGTFTEEVAEGACLKDADCDGGFFCNRGGCLAFVPDRGCGKDEDCVLIDSEFNLGCCRATTCKPIDYSEESWIAVNKAWLAGQQEEYCPQGEACGPAPMCSERILDKTFKAVCAEGECDKVPT